MNLFSFRGSLLCFSALLLWVLTANANIRALQHSIDLRLHPESQIIQVTDRIRIAPSPRTVSFWLHPGSRIENVRQGVSSLPFAFNDGQLTLKLPPGDYGTVTTVEISYSLKLPPALPPAAAHHEDPSYGIAAALGPAGAFLGGGARWYPQMDGVRPVMDIRVFMPRDWEAVTNGKLLERTYVHGAKKVRWQVRLNRPGMALAAGPWIFAESSATGIPLYTFFSQSNARLAEKYSTATATYLSEYSQMLGPYPFDKFAIADNYFESGYGYASWTLLGRNVLRLPFILRTSLPHEIVHNWFGNGVLVDYAEGNWSEGLTSYLADYYQSEKSGPGPARDYRQKVLRNFASLVGPQEDMPLTRFHYRMSAADQAIGYGKAMMVFHMLRKYIGEEPFWEGLRLITRQRMNLETRWSHFQRAFEITSGKNLDEFFRQWVSRPGVPQLSLQGVETFRDGDQWRVVGHLHQKGDPYMLDVPVRLTTKGGVYNSTVMTRGADRALSFSVADPPLRLEVDPEVHLLRKLYPSELPPTINSIRGSKNLLVVLSDDLSREVSDRARALLAAMRQDTAPVKAEAKVTKSDLRNHDLLFIGVPKRKDLLPTLPSLLSLKQDGFSLGPQTFANTSDVLFTALSNSHARGKVAALFLPKTTMDAEIAARKIPHYGKYSYLVFRSGVNRVKATWPPENSPLIHRFPGG